MDDLTLQSDDSACFHRVWERVMGDNPSDVMAPKMLTAPNNQQLACYNDTASLPLLGQAIQCLCECVVTYQYFSRTMPKQYKKYISYLINVAKQQIYQLKTAYFLICGSTYVPTKPEGISKEGVLHTLRDLYLATEQWQSVYQKRAMHCNDRCLTPLFLSLDRQCTDVLATLKRLIELILSDEQMTTQ